MGFVENRAKLLDDLRMVAYYIAGMTDRFAMVTHARLVGTHERG